MSPPPTLDIEELERLRDEPLFITRIDCDKYQFIDTYGNALKEAAPALFAAARERDALKDWQRAIMAENSHARKALRVAEEFVANELELRLGEMRSDYDVAEARSCLALIRSALGTDGEGK